MLSNDGQMEWKLTKHWVSCQNHAGSSSRDLWKYGQERKTRVYFILNENNDKNAGHCKINDYIKKSSNQKFRR